MKPIAVIVHVDHEGPGYLADVLAQRAIPFDVISIGRGDTVPKHVESWSAIVSMGGPMSVNDSLPWIADECALLRAAVAADRPVLGHCLGAQMMSKALGGAVTKNPIREIGWFDVQPVPSTVAAHWLRDLPASMPAFHWHGETFSIPPGATRLLTNSNCVNQGFAIGKSLALQCHIEMTEALIQDWVRRSPEEFQAPVGAVQSAQEILRDLEPRTRALRQVAEKIYDHWLEGLLQD